MKNKKGTHVGIILSFVIFVTFLIFMSTVIKPSSKVQDEKEYTINLLKTNLLNAIEKNVKVVSINAPASLGESCLTVNDEFSSLGFGIVNSSGTKLAGVRSGGNIYTGWTGEALVKVYYAEGLETSSSASTSGCATGEIKNVMNKKIVLEEELKKIIGNYSTNYSQVRSDLGIPLKDEFNIQFDYRNGVIIGNASRDELQQDIYVKIFQINYLDKYANEKLGDLRIYAW